MTGGNPLTDEELLLDSEAWEGDEDLFLPDGTAEVERPMPLPSPISSMSIARRSMSTSVS